MAFSLEGHGSDGASVLDDDHPAQRVGKLELVHVADVRHRQQGKPHAAVGSSGFYDGGRLLSGTADGRIYSCGFPGRHPVPVCPQIHRPRRCARRPEGLKNKHTNKGSHSGFSQIHKGELLFIWRDASFRVKKPEFDESVYEWKYKKGKIDT